DHIEASLTNGCCWTMWAGERQNQKGRRCQQTQPERQIANHGVPFFDRQCPATSQSPDAHAPPRQPPHPHRGENKRDRQQPQKSWFRERDPSEVDAYRHTFDPVELLEPFESLRTRVIPCA